LLKKAVEGGGQRGAAKEKRSGKGGGGSLSSRGGDFTRKEKKDKIPKGDCQESVSETGKAGKWEK